VRNLAAFNGVVIVMLVAYAYFLKMPLAEIVPLVLTAILASIPVALPATFTLAAALGARALAKLGVLPTRLSAVDEAGTTDVLCADKTGTLTQNALTVTAVRPMPGFDEAHVLALAALASSEGGQDPVDGAIRAAAASKTVSDALKLVNSCRSIRRRSCPRRPQLIRPAQHNVSLRAPLPRSSASHTRRRPLQNRRRSSRGTVSECWRSAPDRRRR